MLDSYHSSLITNKRLKFLDSVLMPHEFRYAQYYNVELNNVRCEEMAISFRCILSQLVSH